MALAVAVLALALPSLGQETGASDAKIKVVEVIGKGKTMDEAKRNAFSLAVEQVVGVLVDAETVVQNEDLIRSDILTYSAGYVEKYQVLKSAEKEGLFGVRIRAFVVVDKLRGALLKKRIITEDVDGQSLFAQIASQAKEEGDFGAMLINVFKKYDFPKLLVPKMHLMEVLARNDEEASVRLRFWLSLEADEKAANAFYTEFTSLLKTKWKGEPFKYEVDSASETESADKFPEIESVKERMREYRESVDDEFPSDSQPSLDFSMMLPAVVKNIKWPKNDSDGADSCPHHIVLVRNFSVAYDEEIGFPVVVKAQGQIFNVDPDDWKTYFDGKGIFSKNYDGRGVMLNLGGIVDVRSGYEMEMKVVGTARDKMGAMIATISRSGIESGDFGASSINEFAKPGIYLYPCALKKGYAPFAVDAILSLKDLDRIDHIEWALDWEKAWN